MFPVLTRGRVFAALAALHLLSACPPSTAQPEVIDSATIPFSGLVALSTGTGFFLFDPTTGATEALQHPAIELAFSPDARRVAYLWPESATSRQVIVAEPTLVDGKPGLREIRRWPWATDEAAKFFRFSTDGRRIVTQPFLFDVESGAVVGCDRRNKTTNAVLDLVDTGRFACRADENDSLGLYALDGGALLARYGDRFGESPYLAEVSPDSQWFGEAIHAPSATVRARPPPALQPWTGSADFNRLPLRDGRFGFLSTGTNGKKAVNESSLGANSVVVIREYKTLPQDGFASDLAARYQARDWAAEPSGWGVANGLKPWLNVGEGRDWRPLGVTADGDGLLMLVKSWSISINADPNIDPQNFDIEHSVVELRRDGSSRGFRTSALFPGKSEQASGSTYREVGFLNEVALGEDWSSPVIDLGGTDWLVAVKGGFAGFLGGTAVGLNTHDSAAFDGDRGIVEVEFLTPDGSKRRFCTFSLDAPQSRRCMPLTVKGTILGVVAHDVRAGSGPALSRLSRTAAWPGSTVTVAGHGFGTSAGEVRLGGVSVPAEQLLSWSSSQVTFGVPASLPAKAKVELRTSAGATAGGRGLVLHRTELVPTPFADVVADTQRLGQGLNRLAATGVPAGVQGIGGPKLISLGDGGFVVSMTFTNDGGSSSLLLDTGTDARRLNFTLERRLADATKWQPVLAGSANSQWSIIGGALVDVFGQVSTRFDTQFHGCNIVQRTATNTRAGLPDHWNAAGTLAANSFGVGPVTGWRGTATCEPQYGTLANPATKLGVASAPSTVIATGTFNAGSTSAPGFALSQNQGSTFATPVSAAAVLGRTGTVLVNPVWMGSLAAPAFLVAERPQGFTLPYRTSLHAVSPAGVLTSDVATLPAAFPGDVPGSIDRVISAVDGTRLALWFSNARTLVVGDFAGAPPVALSVQPAAGDSGRVSSVWFDETAKELYAVMVDGQVLKASAAGGWKDWAPFELGIALEVPTRVVPLAIAKEPGSGRWVVSAALFDARPGAAADAGSLIARNATLLGP